MLVVTSKRLYNVELNVIDDKSAQQPAFQVSYRYPGEERDKASREATARQREWEQKQQQASVQKALNLGADAPQLELHQISGQRQFQHSSRLCL